MKQLDLFTETPKRRLTPVFKGRPVVDLRGVHYREVAPTLTAKAQAVFVALQGIGEGTGSEIAARIGWDVTSVRPRLTELLHAGHIETTGARRDKQHVFRVKI